MFRYVLILLWVCIGFRADAQAVWDSLLTESARLKHERDLEGALAICRYGDSLLLLETDPDSVFLASFSHQAGIIQYNMSQYQASLLSYSKALARCPDTPEGQNIKGTILYDRAFTEYEMERYKQSYETVKEAEAVLAPLENPDYDYLLSIYADLCFQAVDLGYLDEAEKYLLKGEKLMLEHKDDVIYEFAHQSDKEVIFEYNFVLLYSETGEEEKLIEHINKLKAIKKARPFNQGEQYMFAVGLNHVADFYLNFDDRWDTDYPFIQAERYLREAFDALNKEQYPANFVQFTYNQNKAYRKAAKYKLALQGNDYLLSIADSNDYRKPFFFTQRGLIYAASGEKEKAIEAFRRVAELIHTGDEPLKKDYSNYKPSTTVHHADLFAGVMDDLIELYPDDQAVKSLASDFYVLALRQFEFAYQFNSFNPTLRSFYDKIIQGILTTRIRKDGSETILLTDLLTKIEEIENRLAWQEHLLNRRFNELKIPDSLVYREMELRSKLARVKQANQSDLVVFEWEDRLRKFENHIREQYPAHADFVKTAFDVKDFQSELEPGTLVLRYKKAKDNFFLFAISKEKIEQFSLGNKDVLLPEIQSLLGQIQQRKQVDSKQVRARIIPLDVAAYHHLIIIPDGELHDIPFELLQEASTYLIETHSISYATHLVFIMNQRAREATLGTDLQFLAFSPAYGASEPALAMRSQAYRLKGAHEEVKAVSEVFGGHIFEGSKASKATFISQSPSGDILHLAMHADIDNDKPELSYLLFASQTGEQKMFVEELYGLKLKAELAVLSACNTGRSSPDDRKGMVSLHRAFCYAGVPATVASLWAVPDQATKEIMTVFYEKLKSGLSKAEALQQAKLNYIQENDDPHFKHPFFWAGFVLYGDSKPLEANEQAGEVVIGGIIGIGLLLGFLGFIFRRERKKAL